MFGTAKENHVILMEAFAYQHSPFIREIRKLIEESEIGELRYVEAALITSDYDHSNIRMRKETLGGCTYDLSLVQRMTGVSPAQIHAFASLSEEGIDTYTSAILEYENGSKAHVDCGMVLETERNSSLDRFQIHGSKGSVSSVDFGFNAPGTLSYRLRTFDGKDELRSVEVPNNYCLEVEQMGRCIAGEEKPHVTEEFSIALADTVDRILKKIGY